MPAALRTWCSTSPCAMYDRSRMAGAAHASRLGGATRAVADRATDDFAAVVAESGQSRRRVRRSLLFRRLALVPTMHTLPSRLAGSGRGDAGAPPRPTREG